MNCIPLRRKNNKKNSVERLPELPSPDSGIVIMDAATTTDEEEQQQRSEDAIEEPQQDPQACLRPDLDHTTQNHQGRFRTALSNVVTAVSRVFNFGNHNNNDSNSGGNSSSSDGEGNKKKRNIPRSQSGHINRRHYNKLKTTEEDEDQQEKLRPPRTSASFPTALSSKNKSERDEDCSRAEKLLALARTLKEMQEEDEDDEDYGEFWDDEELTCNVCDRAFSTPRMLERHQQKRRHWGCTTCDSLFNSFLELEYHKEQYEHFDGDSQDEEEDNYLEAAQDYFFEEEEASEFLKRLDQDEDLGNWDLDELKRLRRLRRRLRMVEEEELEVNHGVEEEEETEFGKEPDRAMLL